MASFTPNSYFPPQICVRDGLGKCTPDRYYYHFLEHLRPCIPDEDNPKCTICWTPFGTMNRDTGLPDYPVKVCDLPGCRHVFARECLKQVLRFRSIGHNFCPMYRTQWFRFRRIHAGYFPTEATMIGMRRLCVHAYTTRISRPQERYWTPLKTK